MGSIAEFVTAAARRTPTGTALVAGHRRLTWAELDTQVDAVAGGLLARGLATGDRVALLMGNRPEFVLGYLGILRAGLVALPMNAGYTAPEVAAQVGDAAARLLLCETATAQAAGGAEAVLAAAGAAMDVVDVDSGSWGSLLAVGRHTDTPVAPVEADQLAVLLFTSGTSGRPRAAMLSHGALLTNVAQLQQLSAPRAMAPDDVVIAVLPLFHVYALNAVLGLALSVGATVVLCPRFGPRSTLETIRNEAVTVVPGAPPMYLAWSAETGLRDSLAGVRLLSSGAAPLPPAVFDQFATLTGKTVWEGYGLTECAPVVATTLVGGTAKAGSVGRPLPGVEVRLGEPGAEIDAGDPAELFVRSASLFSGYWPDAADGPDAQGWFGTGDIAYLDEEGDLHLVDRTSDLILVNGFNVYPREVELVLEGLPGVAECAVVGVPHPYTGEAVTAYVVPDDGASVSAPTVLAHCERRLARFKCPTIVRIVDALPHSATGKVSKVRLRAQAEG